MFFRNPVRVHASRACAGWHSARRSSWIAAALAWPAACLLVLAAAGAWAQDGPGQAPAPGDAGPGADYSFSIAEPEGELQEGDSAAFTVRMERAPGVTQTGPVRVALAVEDGSAVGTEDFDSSGILEILEFPPGTSEQTIQIPVTDDDYAEAAESFSVVLRLPGSDANGLERVEVSPGAGSATATIAASDAMHLALTGGGEQAPVIEGENLEFTLELWGGLSRGDIRVRLDTSDEAAIAKTNYLRPKRITQLTIEDDRELPDDVLRVPVYVYTVRDPGAPPLESFRLIVVDAFPVSRAFEIAIAPGQESREGFISNQPAVRLSLSETTIPESAGPTLFTLTAELAADSPAAPASGLNIPIRTYDRSRDRKDFRHTLTTRVGEICTTTTRDLDAEPLSVTIPVDTRHGETEFCLLPTDNNTADRARTSLVFFADARETGTLPVVATHLRIEDDEVAPTAIAWFVERDTVNEGEGVAEVEVWAELQYASDDNTAVFERDISLSVDVLSVGLDPPDASDFSAEALEVVIPARSRSSERGTLRLTLVDDDISEGPEKLRIRHTGKRYIRCLAVRCDPDPAEYPLTMEPAFIIIEDDDNAAGVIQLALSHHVVNEGAGPTDVTVTANLLGATLAEELQLSVGLQPYESENIPAARSGSDYAPAEPPNITIQAGASSGAGTFSFEPVDDEEVERTERVAVTGTILPGDGPGASGITVQPALLTIEDNEPAGIVLSTRGVRYGDNPADNPGRRVYEGRGIARVRLRAEFTGPTSSALPRAERIPVKFEMIPYSRWAGTGGAGFTLTQKGPGNSCVSEAEITSHITVTIPAGQSYGDVWFCLKPDDDNYFQRNRRVDIGAVSTYTAYPVEPALLRIREDETQPSVEFSLAPPDVPEGDESAEITVTARLVGEARFSEAIALPIRIGIATGKAATVGADYSVADRNLRITIPRDGSEGSETFTLSPEPDNIAEGDETVTIGLSGSAYAYTTFLADFSRAYRALTIMDDDPVPEEIELKLSRHVVREGDPSREITVTASLPAGSATLSEDIDISVTLAPYGIGDLPDATAADYRAGALPLIITIPKETTDGFNTFSFEPVNDLVVERSERLAVAGTITTTEVHGASGITVRRTHITIEDNDRIGTIQLTVDPTNIPEDDDAGASLTSTVMVTGTFTGGVTYGDDVLFTPLVTQGSPVEDVILQIRVPAGDASFTFPLPVTPQADRSVDGETQLSISGTACIDWGCTPLDPAATIPVQPAHLTIDDNDAPPTTIEIRLRWQGETLAEARSELLVPEGSGQAFRYIPSVHFVDGGSASFEDAIEVTLRNGDITQPVTIPGGERSGSADLNFPLPASGDDRIAGDQEAARWEVREEDRALVPFGGGARFNTTPARIRVVDNDTNILLAARPNQVRERVGVERITVSATIEGVDSSTLGDPVVVPITFSDVDTAGADDYFVTLPNADNSCPVAATETSTPASLGGVTIPPHMTSGEAHFCFRPVDDAMDEGDETVQIDGGRVPSPYTVSHTTLTILDENPVLATVTAPGGTLSESAEEAVFTVELNRAAPVDARLRWSISPGSATAGQDYTAPSENTLVIANGMTTAEIRIPLLGDEDLEGPETLGVTLERLELVGRAAGDAGIGDPATAQITLEDDDRVTVTIASTDALESAGQVDITLSLDLPAGVSRSREVYFEWATTRVLGAPYTATPGEDYTQVAPTPVRFPPGQDQQVVSVAIIDDDAFEADETFSLLLTGASPLVDLEGGLRADIITIIDDDQVTATLVQSQDPVSESADEAVFTVELNRAHALRTARVRWSISPESSVAPGQDYTAPAETETTLEIAPSATSGKIRIPLLDDRALEGPETLGVTLESIELVGALLEGAAELGDPATAELTIEDDESARVRVNSNLRGIEGEDSMGFTISLEIDEDIEHPPIHVFWYTAELTANEVDDDYEAAVPGDDYYSVGETELIFLHGGSRARNVRVRLVDDEEPEEPERYWVRLAMRPGPLSSVVTLPLDSDWPLQGRAEIHDDDFTPPAIELDVRPTSVIEGESSREITVSSRFSDDPDMFLPVEVTIDLALENGTADDNDYTASPLGALTIAAFSTRGDTTFTFTAHDDVHVEEVETVRINGTLEGYEIKSDTLSIVSEDEAPTSIILSIVPNEIHEGVDGGATVTLDNGEMEFDWSSFGIYIDFEEGADALDRWLIIPVHFFVRYWTPERGIVSRPVTWIGGDERRINYVLIPPGQTRGLGGFNTKFSEDDIFEPYSEMYIRAGQDFTDATGYETNEAILSFADNDDPPSGVELTFFPALISEDEVPAEVTLTATLQGSQLPYEVQIPLAPEDLESAGVLAITKRGDAGCSLAPPARAPDLFVTIQAAQWEGETSLCIYPHDNHQVEDDRELVVSADPLEAPPRYQDYPVTSATLIIEEAYTPPEGVMFSLEPAEVHEGAGPTQVTVTATLTGGDGGTFPYLVRPFITLQNGTAGDDDYTFENLDTGETFDTTGPFVGIPIAAGTREGSAVVTFTPVQDKLLEANETLEIGEPPFVRFDDERSSGTELTVTPALFTIWDDDTKPTIIELIANPAAVAEGSGAYTIGLTAAFQDGGVLQDPVTVPVRVLRRYWTPWAPGGPGYIENDKYPGDSSFEVTIPALKRAGVEIPLYSDTSNGDNRFTVREHQIRAASDYDGAYTVLPATVNFEENDAPPSGITLELTPGGIAEGDPDATEVELVARLEGRVRLPYRVEIPLDFSDLDAAGVEFRSRNESGGCTETALDRETLPLTVITIPALALASAPVPFCVFPHDDLVARGDRELTISAEPVLAPPGYDPYPVTAATLAVSDDDTPPTSVVLAVQPSVLEEGDGDVAMTLTAVFQGGTGTLPDALHIPLAFFERYWTPAETVEAPYGEDAPSAVVIQAEQSSGALAFPWSCPESEAFIAGLEWPVRAAEDYAHADTYPVTDARIGCNDNDPPPSGVTLRVSPGEIHEGAGPTEVTLTATLEGTSTLPYNDNIILLFSDVEGVAFPNQVGLPCTEASFGDEASEVFIGGTVTIRAGETSGQETFCMKALDDYVVVDDRRLVISAVDRPAPPGAPPYPVAPATLAIREDDTAPGDIIISLAPGEVGEDDGLTPIRVTAAFRDDGRIVLPGALEIPLEPGGDSSAYHAFAAPDAAACGSVSELAPAAPGPAAAPGPPGAGAVPTPDPGAVPTQAPGAAPARFSVVIPARERSGEVFLCFTPSDDTRYAGDRLVPVSPVDPEGALGDYAVTPPPDLIIREDETLPSRVLLMLGRAESGEGAASEPQEGDEAAAQTGAPGPLEIPETGSAELVLTARFPEADGALPAADTQVSIPLEGAAKVGYGSYEVVPAQVSVTIPAGARSSDPVRFTLTPEDDNVVERESIDLGGGGRATAALNWLSDFAAPGRPDSLPVDGAGAELHIIDDDEALITLEAPAAPVDEGEPALFTVRLSNPVDGPPVTVEWFTSDDSAEAGAGDYEARPGETVQLFARPPDLAQAILSVSVLKDEVSENEERFNLSLGAALGDDFGGRVRVSDGAATAQAVIAANGPIMLVLEGPPGAVAEGEDAVFRVSLRPEGALPDTPIHLDYATLDGTAEAPQDYTGVTGTLSFTDADATPRELHVATIDNRLYDGDRNFTFHLLGVRGGSERRPLTVLPPPAEAGGSHSAQAVIVDDETPPELHLLVTPGEISEAAAGTAGGRSTLSVEVRGSAFVETRTIEFSFGGDATLNEDYSVSSTTLEIPAGALGAVNTVQVEVVNDEVDDDAEWILVSARVLEEDIEVLGNARQILIHDDDDPWVTVSFSEAFVEISEGHSHGITALLDAPPEREVVIPLTAFHEGGAGREDYDGVPAALVFGPDATEQAFTLHVLRDRADEHGAGEGVRVFIDAELLPERVLLGEPPGVSVSFVELPFGEDIQHAFKYALASFGRSVAMSTLDVIEDRFEVTGDPLRSSYLAVGGMRVPLGAMRRLPRGREAKGSRRAPALREAAKVLGVRVPRRSDEAGDLSTGMAERSDRSYQRPGRSALPNGRAGSIDGGYGSGLGSNGFGSSSFAPGGWSGEAGGTGFTSASRHAGGQPGDGGTGSSSSARDLSTDMDARCGPPCRSRGIGRGGDAPDMRVRIDSPGSRDLLSRSSFSLTPGTAGTVPVDSAWTIWGRSDVRSFDGNPGGQFALDATTFSTHLGVDYRRSENLLTGFSLSHSVGDMSYVDAARGDNQGDFRAHLTALNHYSHWSYSENLDLYVVMGEGFGIAEITEYGKRAKTDINMHTSILGARRGLTPVGALALAAKADAFLVEVESDARPAIGLPKITAHVMRMRAMLEGSAQSTLLRGARLKSQFEMGILLDAGDADRGEGMEFGTEFHYVDDMAGVELSGRWMLAYASGGYQEWGAALTLNLDPGAPGRGVRLSLAPDWGTPAGGGVDAMWRGTLERNTADAEGDGRRRGASPEQVKMELAYGMGLQGGTFGRVEPFGTWFFEDSGAWNMRLGVRLELSRFARSETGKGTWLPNNLQMELVGERHTALYREDEHRIGIKFNAGF